MKTNKNSHKLLELSRKADDLYIYNSALLYLGRIRRNVQKY